MMDNRLDEIRQRAEQLVRIADNPYCLGPAALLDGVKEIVPALLSEIDRLTVLHKREIIVTGEYAQRVIALTARAEAAEAERDAAIADITHGCDTCIRCQDCEAGTEPECAHCYGNVDAWNTYEDSWDWRGPEAAKGGE